MKKIFKYGVGEPGSEVKLSLRVGAKVVHFDVQNDQLFIWVLLDPTVMVTVIRMFQVLGTGWDIPSDSEYVATVLHNQFVWHLFEVK